MLRYTQNYSLLSHNTFGIDCQAATYVTYETAQDVMQMLRDTQGASYLPIGMGSNLLFLSSRFDGVVMHSENHEAKVVEESDTHVLLRAGAGWVWDDFVFHTLCQGWYGLENLSYIPGETGASAVQNVGAFGVEAGQLIDSVEAVDLRTGMIRQFSHDELHYAYRHSFFKLQSEVRQWAIVYVTYRLSKQFTPNLTYKAVAAEVQQRGIVPDELLPMDLRDIITDIRRSKLPEPTALGSAGSFFKNPVVPKEQFAELQQRFPNIVSFPVDEQHVKLSAGWLIDQLGWRGRNIGPAGVYEKQALVIVNHGGATGQDVLRVCEAVRQDVLQTYGVELQPEVNFIA